MALPERCATCKHLPSEHVPMNWRTREGCRLCDCDVYVPDSYHSISIEEAVADVRRQFEGEYDEPAGAH